MNFRSLVKTINTTNYREAMIDPKEIKAQYNPERFHLWISLHKGPVNEEFNMLYSPHYRFLKDRKDTSYYQLQRLYGRNNKWINAKVKKFLGVYESMKKEGFKESIMIVEKPLVANKYNKGYEIFEGHHRVACALFLDIKEVSCQFIIN